MGLDAVQFVMEVEDRFGVQIPDSDVENVITVGEFVNVVYSHLQSNITRQPDDKGCFTPDSALAKIKSVLSGIAGVKSSRIHLYSSLDDLIPVSDRARVWPMVVKELGIDAMGAVQSSVSPDKERFLLLYIAACVAICMCLSYSILNVILVVIASCILWRAIRCLWKNVYFPSSCLCVNDLVKYIGCTSQNSNYSKEVIFIVIKSMLVELFDINPEEIKSESRFYED